ncbi:MAG: hypothetical protein GY793_02505 [Proteobacteria bacterium]|nr:hypothetical protein [Pseudomonadota bacterium]
MPADGPSGDPRYVRKVAYLLNSTKHGWKGPYINKQLQTPTETSLYTKDKYRLYLLSGNNTQWSNFVELFSTGVCSSTADCYVWIHVSGVYDTALLKEIERIVDNNDGQDKGNFRFSSYRMYLKYAPFGVPPLP